MSTLTKEQKRLKWNAYQREYKKKNHILVKARKKIAHLKERDILKDQPCEICGAKKAEMHHDDYSKPLQVRPLCKKHHWEFHKTHMYNPKTFRYHKI